MTRNSSTIIRSIKGLEVALTGECGQKRETLIRRIRRKGGRVSTSKARVTEMTAILVRGSSHRWQYGSHGEKEDYAANLIRCGSPLVVVSAPAFLDFLDTGKNIRVERIVAGQLIDHIRNMQRDEELFGELDTPRMSTARVEQTRLRQLLLRKGPVPCCAICGLVLPDDLLRAAHIKLRAVCEPKERRDLEHIAMLLCEFGCDALYERGLITVDDDGLVELSARCKKPRSGLHQRTKHLAGKTCRAYTDDSVEYFRWHRENVFVG